MATRKRRNISLFENIRLSLRGLLTHKMRSFLTMLGIIIGIAAIIAIVSTIKGTNEQIKQNLIGKGTNTVTVQLNQGEYAYEFDWNSIPEGVGTISADTKKKLEKIDHVQSVSLYRKRGYADGIYHGGTSIDSSSLYGIDENYFYTAGYQVIQGRGITAEDLKNFRKVIVLEDSSAEALFASEDPLGRTVEIQQEPYTVVGVVREVSTFEPVIESVSDYYLYNDTGNSRVYIPSSTWPMIYQFDEPESVVMRVDETDAMAVAGKDAEKVLNATISPSDETIQYGAEDVLKQAENLQQLSKSTNSMLIWIAAISLLVGGIGVMNIMLVSVTERTREIGLKKALGARRNVILMQFLTEAAVLTSIGGILGILTGIGLAYLISAVAGVPVAISGLSIVIAFVFSALVGIIFGLLPSIKASRLDPIEALRYE